jgi:hypothetical protein
MPLRPLRAPAGIESMRSRRVQSGGLPYHPPYSLHAATISCRNSDMPVCGIVTALTAKEIKMHLL